MKGGGAVCGKRHGCVQVTFAGGEVRGTGHGEASAYVDATAATLPADIQDRIMRKRKPRDADAAIDPPSLPEVKAAVQRATFDLLVGFQLTQAQPETTVRREGKAAPRRRPPYRPTLRRPEELRVGSRWLRTRKH